MAMLGNRVLRLFITAAFLMLATLPSKAGNQEKLSSSINTDSLEVLELVHSADSLKLINYRRSIAIAQRALALAHKTNSLVLINKALAINALLDWYDGNHSTALEKCFEGLKISQTLMDTAGIANRYTQIGLVYLYTSDFDTALFYHKKALFHYNTLADTTGILKTYGYIGLIYNHQADYVKAKENLLATVLIKRQFETTKWNILQLPKNIEFNRTYYTKSLVSAQEVLSMYDKNSLASMEKRFAYHNVGLAYLNLAQPENALQYFKKSAKIAKELKMDVFWNEISRAFINLQLYDSAIWANKKSLINALDHGSRISQANSYVTLGKIYASMGTCSKAIIAFQKVLQLAKNMGHRYSAMTTMLKIAESAIQIDNLGVALSYADSSMWVAETIGAKKGVADALMVKYRVLDLKGAYKVALKIKQEYDVLDALLQKGETQLQLAKLDLFNEVELNRLEIADLNRREELSSANLKNQALTIIIIALVGLSVALVLLLNYIRTRKLVKLNNVLQQQQNVISRQNEQLAESNSEKEILLGEIHHRVKNNLQVISSLLSVQSLQLSDGAAREAVLEGQNRVQTMGLIHESLYQNEMFDKIDMQTYLEKLIGNLFGSFGYSSNQIRLTIDAEKNILEVDTAINIGLITNELVTNALKHAFTRVDSEKELIVRLIIENERLVLLIEDNGNGCDIKVEKSNSFGLQLVKQIIRKYEGELLIQSNNGTSAKVILNCDFRL